MEDIQQLKNFVRDAKENIARQNAIDIQNKILAEVEVERQRRFPNKYLHKPRVSGHSFADKIAQRYKCGTN